MNYLNLEIIKPLDDHRDQTEGFYSIVDLYHNQVKIRNEKFYDNIKRTFMRKGEIDLDKNPEAIACLLNVKIKDPIESIYLIRTKFANITGDLFKSLLTSKDQRKRLVKIADRFLSEDYEGMIKETGIIPQEV